jgi:hypothetical protein
MKNLYFVILLTIVTLNLGCNDCEPSKEATENMSIEKSQITKQIYKANHSSISSFSESQRSDSIIFDYNYFPYDSFLTTKVLGVGTFHSDEVWNNVEKENWFGLFQNSTGFYIAATKLKTKRVNDILDENVNVKTGWEIKTTNKDSCLLLIEQQPYIKNSTIQNIKLSTKYIYPEDTLSFRYLGNDYKIFATGGKKKVQVNPEWFDVWNYKLYITTTINGKTLKSLLVAQPNFDDKMIEIIFAGDVDGDKVLDLIIDTSRHYNGTRPTIYLSRPASDGEVLKAIGMHSSVGC